MCAQPTARRSPAARGAAPVESPATAPESAAGTSGSSAPRSAAATAEAAAPPARARIARPHPAAGKARDQREQERKDRGHQRHKKRLAGEVNQPAGHDPGNQRAETSAKH